MFPMSKGSALLLASVVGVVSPAVTVTTVPAAFDVVTAVVNTTVGKVPVFSTVPMAVPAAFETVNTTVTF